MPASNPVGKTTFLKKKINTKLAKELDCQDFPAQNPIAFQASLVEEKGMTGEMIIKTQV